MTSENKSNKGNSSKVILIVLILLIAGVNVYQFMHGKQEEERFNGIITEKESTINDQVAELEALKQDLMDAQDSLTSLGEQNAELNDQIDAINKDLKYYKGLAWNRKQKNNELREIIAGHKELIKKRDAKIAELLVTQDSLNSQNTDLKVKIDSQSVSIEEYKEEINEKDEIIATARELKSGDFRFTSVNSKGKEKSGTLLKAKQIDKLKIEFKLEENKVAVTETKEVYVQIKDPNNNTIYDLESGSGTFEIEEKEQYYTVKSDVLYDNSKTDVIVYFQKGSPFEKGQYTVTIYCEGAILGSSVFGVK